MNLRLLVGKGQLGTLGSSCIHCCKMGNQQGPVYNTWTLLTVVCQPGGEHGWRERIPVMDGGVPSLLT